MLDRGPLLFRQILVPPERLEHRHGELGITVLDLRALGIDPFRQEIHTVPLHAEARTEAHAAIGDRLAQVIEVRRTRMSELRSPPAGPGQAIVVAVART